MRKHYKQKCIGQAGVWPDRKSCYLQIVPVTHYLRIRLEVDSLY